MGNTSLNPIMNIPALLKGRYAISFVPRGRIRAGMARQAVILPKCSASAKKRTAPGATEMLAYWTRK